jgi:hypothetical protein
LEHPVVVLDQVFEEALKEVVHVACFGALSNAASD